MDWRSGAAAVKWIPALNLMEDRYGIPKNLLARQCFEESRFNPQAINSSGATGIMQLLPKYFPGAGQDPIRDIKQGGEYLAALAKGFKGDWTLALAGYDWGPGSVRKWLKKKRSFSEMPVETQNYVNQILAD